MIELFIFHPQNTSTYFVNGFLNPGVMHAIHYKSNIEHSDRAGEYSITFIFAQPNTGETFLLKISVN